MSDPDNPTLDTISGQPSGWFDDSKWSGVNVSAHDPGLGVSNVMLNIEGAPQVTLKPAPCYGTHDSPCPRDMSGTIPFNGDNFDEGLSLVKVNASDALSKSSGVQSFWAYVDSTAPEITLSGQLASATEEAEGNSKDPKEWDDLSLPVYNLAIKAKDGNPKYASNKERRSGTKNIEVFVDGTKQTVSWAANPSPCENCEMNVNFQLKLEGLAAGKHTLLVVAADQLGHKSQRDIEFEYIPATGMKDDYVMQHFALPDGQGNEAEEEHPKRPELAVNVMNGNLTYREKDVDVPGYAADLEVERFYNSQLPNSENTEWGDGWTLAQTPELEPEAGTAPKEAELLDTSGALEDDVQLPTETGKTKFNPPLQASLTKEAGGGYELTDESGETATSIAFDSSGRTDELRTGDYAKIDYDYEAGKLDEIAVKDPGSASSISPAEEEVLDYVPPAPTYKGTTIAPMGLKEGQLVKPTDAVMAKNGDLFVVDPNLNWVQRFAQDGKFISKIGTKGSENGQFKEPTQLAIDSAGNLYVLDAGNVRIQKFKENGEFIKAFKLTLGTADGQINGVGGMALDAKGNLYLADPSNDRVQKFNANMEYVAKFGSFGTGNGQFTNPNAVAIGPGGTIWITDSYQGTITEFNEAGGFVGKFGSAGSGNGQLKNPMAIEIDSRGNVWVFDAGNGRVEQFNQSGKYLTKFGAGSGSKEEQFAAGPNEATGIVVDNKGGIWVVDAQNARVPKWAVPNYRPSWTYSFGTLGSGDGQVKSPADVDLAANGDLLVLDKGNNRVVRFDRSSLKFISKFGTAGPDNGQFSAPNSLAVDPSGNIWVADSGNYRVKEFSDEGTFIRAFGSSGTGDGQFSKVEGIATDLKGNVYVADTYNKRVQVFDEEGKFLFKFGSAGSGLGQFTEANAIDVGRHGNVYVADWGLNRVEKFDEKGQALLQFGSGGTGEGQFNHADAVEADNKGNVWVGDQTNGRIELFNESGEYLTQFGAVGSGEGQFKFTYPMGIAVDSGGGIWITDVLNNRIQKWQVPNTDPPKPPEENDPAVDVSLSSGLVSSVEGEEAGTNTYAHTGELLTANKGPDGEVKYEYDAASRLKKVTLPNGTYGSITYNTTYGRVSKVTVDPAGPAPAKSTSFAYSDEPRKTTVTPEGGTIISYDIGADGSVVKWQDKNAPPTIDNISGSLYANRGKEVNTGVQNVVVKAHTPQGISSIQVITNGTNLVDEANCTENEETTKVECEYVENEWVMETEDFAPGRLNLEAIVTDRKGEASTERFWLNIPPPPPPAPAGLPVKPKFKDILHFREEFGLEVWDPVSGESELNDRIFDSINGWTTEDPVSRASWERWGVPLRTPDVAELEYRMRYLETDGPLIRQWAEATHPNTYAGYYVDHRAGGIVHVGFTQGQSTVLEELKGVSGLIATDRFAPFQTQPTYGYSELASLQTAIIGKEASHGALRGVITRASLDTEHNLVKVGATNVAQVSSQLATTYGASAPISVYADTQQGKFTSAATRFTDEGPLRAGQAIGWYNAANNHKRWCTAGLPAAENVGNSKNGVPQVNHFMITAGHCFVNGHVVSRFHVENDKDPKAFGTVRRRANDHEQDGYFTDAEAIEVNIDPKMIARNIVGNGKGVIPIDGVAVAEEGMQVCISGAKTDRVKCSAITGEVEAFPVIEEEEGVYEGPFYVFRTNLPAEPGDSGSPIWEAGSRKAVGLDSIGGSGVAWFTPLLPPPLPEKGLTPYDIPKRDKVPGLLNAPGMGNMHIMSGP
jgi:YD repeat-containing protein